MAEMTDMLFDFSVKLMDKDGDSLTVDGLYNPLNEIERFLSCTKKEAVEVLDRLKGWDVYAAPCQIILAKNGLIEHNFEMYGQTYWHGHKYNTVNEWDFRSFVENGKAKKKTAAKPCKGIQHTCTERQIKKAMQLDYARSIGFDIGQKDYRRFVEQYHAMKVYEMILFRRLVHEVAKGNLDEETVKSLDGLGEVEA